MFIKTAQGVGLGFKSLRCRVNASALCCLYSGLTISRISGGAAIVREAFGGATLSHSTSSNESETLDL